MPEPSPKPVAPRIRSSVVRPKPVRNATPAPEPSRRGRAATGAVMIRPVAVLGAVVAIAGRSRSEQPTPLLAGRTRRLAGLTGSVTTVRQATVVCPDVSGGVGRGSDLGACGRDRDVKPRTQIPATTVTAATAKDFAPADKPNWG